MSNEQSDSSNFENRSNISRNTISPIEWLKSEWREEFHGKGEVFSLVGGAVLLATGIAAKIVDESLFLDANQTLNELSHAMSFGFVSVLVGIGVWYRRGHKGN